MRGSLPRPLFSAMVMAFAIIVLTPTPLLADAATPFVFYTGTLMVLGLIPVILIEALVLRRRLKLEKARAIRVAAVANLASTIVGILLQIVQPRSFLSWTHPSRQGADFFVPFLILLVLLFFVSWLVEYPVARSILGPNRPGAAALSSAPPPPSPYSRLSNAVPSPRPSLWRGVFDANLASYVFLVMAVGALWVKDVVNPPPPWLGQASAVGSLRTINTAEITYASTYNRGYSPTLAALGLGKEASYSPTASAAGLIPSDLAAGVHSGYRFTYTPGPPDTDRKIQTYTVSAMPIRPEWPLSYYYTDQTGVIRVNATRPASATDSPVRG